MKSASLTVPTLTFLMVVGLVAGSLIWARRSPVVVDFVSLTNVAALRRETVVVRFKSVVGLPVLYISQLELRNTKEWEPFLAHETMFSGAIMPMAHEELKFQIPDVRGDLRIRTEFHVRSHRLQKFHAWLNRHGVRWLGDFMMKWGQAPNIVVTLVQRQSKGAEQ